MFKPVNGFLKRWEDALTVRIGAADGLDTARFSARAQIDAVRLWCSAVVMIPFMVWSISGGGLVAWVGMGVFGFGWWWFTIPALRTLSRYRAARRAHRERITPLARQTGRPIEQAGAAEQPAPDPTSDRPNPGALWTTQSARIPSVRLG